MLCHERMLLRPEAHQTVRGSLGAHHLREPLGALCHDVRRVAHLCATLTMAGRNQHKTALVFCPDTMSAAHHRGASGFVQLAQDTETGEMVAIKCASSGNAAQCRASSQVDRC